MSVQESNAAPISPAFSNLYMRRFVPGWKALGHEQRLDVHIVSYADDFVICCRGGGGGGGGGGGDQARAVMTAMMSKLKLAVNEAKTHVCRVPQETFDFLGYTFGRCYSPRTGRSYIGTRPSKRRITRICGAISEITGRAGVPVRFDERDVETERPMPPRHVSTLPRGAPPLPCTRGRRERIRRLPAKRAAVRGSSRESRGSACVVPRANGPSPCLTPEYRGEGTGCRSRSPQSSATPLRTSQLAPDVTPSR